MSGLLSPAPSRTHPANYLSANRPSVILMDTQPARPATLRLAVTLRRCFLSLCTSFVEQSARALGLGDREALSLTLAAEEIFIYLAEGAASDQDLRIECQGGGHEVTVIFTAPSHTLDLRAFNITSRSITGDDEPSAELGLLIAARMVDRLRFSQQGGEFHLAMSKDRAYPAADATPFPIPDAGPAVTIKEPDAAELHLLLQRIQALPSGRLPAEFATTGKVVDMAAAGVYQAAVAVDAAANPGGGLLWRRQGDRLVECYGPYLFGQSATIARRLLDRLLGSLAKSRAVGLLCRYPAPDLPADYFEALGTLHHQAPDGSVTEIPAYYRQLIEDAGAIAWCHPEVQPFLTSEYRRLAFARTQVPLASSGAMVDPYSVLTAAFNRPAGEVTLRPLWWGADALANLSAHVRVLRQEGFYDLFFEMDLGQAWQGHFTPALLATGFRPRLILPNAGQGDTLVFQCEAQFETEARP
ncbi:ATP-binding protein [Candidatus Thiodictyon syntrophicum]|uniref:ATP-binding protein n=1 Tax=Candidatus Thiodictyon syntrophicum TaxID=1166950 RepID=UPI0012FDCEEC|nr:hypothetical protein [Candidatus Thiodictyon syntrophicum]